MKIPHGKLFHSSAGATAAAASLAADDDTELCVCLATSVRADFSLAHSISIITLFDWKATEILIQLFLFILSNGEK